MPTKYTDRACSRVNVVHGRHRVVIVSAYRLHTLHRVMFLSKDPTYDDAAVWSAVELCMSVICCTIPALRPLFAKLLPAMFGSTEQSSGKPKGPGARWISGSSRSGGGSSGGSRRLAGGMSDGSSHGGGQSYDLEKLGGKGGSKVYGTRTVGSSSNDSEEMIIGMPTADLEHTVPPRPRDRVFDGTNGLVGNAATAHK